VVYIFGQSHAPCVGALIEGVPAGIALDMARIEAFMARRAPGGGLATGRRETDAPRVVAGLNEGGKTCGAPLLALIENSDARSKDYDTLGDTPRPGHADYTAYMKFGAARDVRGGGQFSGRLTAPLCFAGGVAMQLPELRGVRVGSHIASIGNAEDKRFDEMGGDAAAFADLAAKEIPALSDAAAENMRAEITTAREAGDSVGGAVEVMAVGIPAGLGEPMFDGVENVLASILFGIPGVRGVEFGCGFEAAKMRGSQHNDAFVPEGAGGIKTATNRHGGVLGGISSGMPLIIRVAFKPTPSIAMEQETVSLSSGEARKLSVSGRHDPCIALRAVPCVEAAIWIALADMMI